MTTRVVNLSKEAYTVYIGRKGHDEDGYFGNPYRVEDYVTRHDCIAAFKIYLLKRVDSDPEFRERVLELRGETLGCFCAPALCHGNIIAAWVDSQFDSD